MESISEYLSAIAGHYRAGRFPAAENLCRQVLALQPNHADALHWLGLIALQGGRPSDAERDFRRALASNPQAAGLYLDLGNALQAQGQLTSAIDSFQHAIRLKPVNATAYYNLGNAYQAQNDFAAAIASYRQAIRFKPDYIKAFYNLGLLLKVQGQLEEAARCFRNVLHFQPAWPEALNELGLLLKIQGNLDEAASKLQQAVTLKPDLADAHKNLASVLKNQGKQPAAIASLQRALELLPESCGTLGQFVHLLQNMCCWDDWRDLSQRLIDAVERQHTLKNTDYCSAFGFLSSYIPTTPEQQLKCARDWSNTKTLLADQPHRDTRVNVAARARNSKLTIGYLSGDFRAHPVAYLTAEMFEKHDRRQFSIRGYSYGRDDGSEIRSRIVNGVDQFVDLQASSFEEAAQRIAADGVDILVDLTGYTQQARTQILSLRPAPVQVSYLGYLATMGAPFIDYVLVDEFVVPPSQQRNFTERLVHLPGCFQVNDSRRAFGPRVPTRAECGLPEQATVFCCFNNSYKIAPETFDVWIEILKSVPGSVLWLTEGNQYVSSNLRHEAATRGVDASRLVFMPRQAYGDYLTRFRLADLFLDTFPYNAGATASDALWAGCPVLTMVGKTFVSRMAGSLLQAVGLPELITTTRSEYLNLALRVAGDPQLRNRLRTHLEARRTTSALYDGEQFARHLERAYRQMWDLHAAGLPPAAFAVDSLP